MLNDTDLELPRKKILEFVNLFSEKILENLKLDFSIIRLMITENKKIKITPHDKPKRNLLELELKINELFLIKNTKSKD